MAKAKMTKDEQRLSAIADTLCNTIFELVRSETAKEANDGTRASIALTALAGAAAAVVCSHYPKRWQVWRKYFEEQFASNLDNLAIMQYTEDVVRPLARRDH